MKKTVSKDLLRQAAANILAVKGGFKVEERTGKGIRPGARWSAKPSKGPAIEVAVRTGRERSLGFSRLSDGNWRTFQGVQLVLCVVPAEKSADDFDVFAFDSKTLGIWFGKALEALEKAARAPELHVPIFIALDEKSKKNLGHNIGGLKDEAVWSASISKKQIEDQSPSEDLEELIDRIKRELAKRNKVDVSRVSVELRMLA